MLQFTNSSLAVRDFIDNKNSWTENRANLNTVAPSCFFYIYVKLGIISQFLQQHENKIVAKNFSFLALNENGNCTKQKMLSGLQVMTR